MQKVFSVPGIATSDEKRLDNVESEIGYVFKHRPFLLKAITHRSDARDDTVASYLGDYENLEFLGDAVLSLVAAEALIRKEPKEDEGLLSQKRSQYVSKDFLAGAGRLISLSDVIKVGNDVKKDADNELPASIVADVVEAIIGAVYLDSGLDAAKLVIHNVLGDLPNETREAGQDAKTALQEKMQASCTLTPAYEVLECVGPPHAPTFVVDESRGGL